MPWVIIRSSSIAGLRHVMQQSQWDELQRTDPFTAKGYRLVPQADPDYYMTCSTCANRITNLSTMDDFQRCPGCTIHCDHCRAVTLTVHRVVQWSRAPLDNRWMAAGAERWCSNCIAGSRRASDTPCARCGEWWLGRGQISCPECGALFCATHVPTSAHQCRPATLSFGRSSRPPSVIHSHDHKPKPIWHGADPYAIAKRRDNLRYFGAYQGTPPRFYGVELETDTSAVQQGEDPSVALDLISAFSPDEKLLYVKHDGSLEGHGFEIVTHPCTLDFHMHKFPWLKLEQWLTERKYGASPRCGLHIHVSRDAIRGNDRIVSHKLLLIMHRLWPQLHTFSRRADEDGGRYAKRVQIDELSHRALHDARAVSGHYAALNITPTHTYEFRLFAGTTSAAQVIASLQLVDALCDLAHLHNIVYISRKLSWDDVVKRAKRGTALHYELEARGLDKLGLAPLDVRKGKPKPKAKPRPPAPRDDEFLALDSEPLRPGWAVQRNVPRTAREWADIDLRARTAVSRTLSDTERPTR